MHLKLPVQMAVFVLLSVLPVVHLCDDPLGDVRGLLPHGVAQAARLLDCRPSLPGRLLPQVEPANQAGVLLAHDKVDPNRRRRLPFSVGSCRIRSGYQFLPVLDWRWPLSPLEYYGENEAKIELNIF